MGLGVVLLLCTARRWKSQEALIPEIPPGPPRTLEHPCPPDMALWSRKAQLMVKVHWG